HRVLHAFPTRRSSDLIASPCCVMENGSPPRPPPNGRTRRSWRPWGGVTCRHSSPAAAPTRGQSDSRHVTWGGREPFIGCRLLFAAARSSASTESCDQGEPRSLDAYWCWCR